MGVLPDGPIVGYLARSTSFFYALLGGLMWTCSFDLPRFRPVLIYLGYAFIVFGLSIFAIDWTGGLPGFWVIVEGPADTVFGIIILYFSSKIPKDSLQNIR